MSGASAVTCSSSVTPPIFRLRLTVAVWPSVRVMFSILAGWKLGRWAVTS
jgi:hypothetical protein